MEFTQSEHDPRTRIELIQLLQSEQGFAIYPIPRGHKGIFMAANCNLDPTGEAYREIDIKEGLSSKPGDRIVITGIKFEHSRIVFELNNGPNFKHCFIRHIELSSGQNWNPGCRVRTWTRWVRGSRSLSLTMYRS